MYRLSFFAFSHAVCAIFGRDEVGSEFQFTQSLVDMLLKRWADIVRKRGIAGAVYQLNADNVMVKELCISDR